MKAILEKRLLQVAVSLACIVPISAGLTGMLRGASFLGGGSPDLDSHIRYLSGLLLAIGLGFLNSIPRIELYTARFRLLTFLVFVGGLGRLLGMLENGPPSISMRLALIMELGVTPLLCLWQARIARKLSSLLSPLLPEKP